MSDDHPPVQSPYILCVTDERPVLAQVCEGLEAANYNVIYAADKAQAVALITQEKPEVLLVDLTTRGGAGWQTYKEIKQHPALSRVTVIDVSARSTRLRYARVDDFPTFDDYIPQSADIERFIHSIKMLVSK